MKQKIKCKAKRGGHQGLKMKVESNGVKKLYINAKAINDALNNGRDVELFDKDTGEALFHVYTMVDQKGVPYRVAQTMNPFRHSINDCEVSLTMDGEVYEGEKARQKIAAESAANKQKHQRVCVTPDSIVECPVCGNEFRVGKVLSNLK